MSINMMSKLHVYHLYLHPFQQRVQSLSNGHRPAPSADMAFSNGFIKDVGSTTPNIMHGVDRVDMDGGGGGGEDLDHLGWARYE